MIEAAGLQSPWSPPTDATPEQQAEFEERFTRMTVPDDAITTSVDVSAYGEARFAALARHATQISATGPFFALGVDGWRELGAWETFILREARVPTNPPETDLFDGLV